MGQADRTGHPITAKSTLWALVVSGALTDASERIGPSCPKL